MPIDLPPVVPPQAQEPAVLEARYEQAQAGTFKVQVGLQTIVITGNSYLSEEQIRRAAKAVDAPSKFILLLNALYTAAGYPFVNVEYGREKGDPTIYVDVTEGFIDKVSAPPLLAPFFEPFEGERDLQSGDLSTAKILAGVKADRAGYGVSAEYEVSQAEPDEFVLTLNTKPDPTHDALTFTTTFGNPGNRFLGRYFGFSGLQYKAPNGDVLGLNYGRSFTSLGDARGGEDYNNWQLSYSTVNTTGFYGFSASYTDYQLNDRFGFGETEEAQTTTVDLQGSQFLYATDTTRWLIKEKLEYIDTKTEVTDAPITNTLADGTAFPVEGQKTREEQYAAFRLGSSLSHSRLIFGQVATVRLKGGYKRGFAGEINNLVNSNRQSDFNLFAGELELIYRLPWDITPKLLLKGQRSISRELPQQQQWVLGGPGQLSAFLPGILIGDNGAYGRFDLQLPSLELGPSAWQLTLFAEAANAEFEDRRGSTAAIRGVADAGVKLKLDVAEWLDISAYHAQSLGERNFEIFPGSDFVEDNEADFFFNVSVKL